jgi:hypothetical protein
MNVIKNLGNWALVALVYALAVIVIGAWWKLMEKLFCIGYGC